MPNLEARSGPRYLAIADALAGDIAQGRLKPGERLPTHRDLGWKLGVTVGTVSRAYAEAERRGLISGEVGRGTYVRDLGSQQSHTILTESAAGAETVNLNFAFPPPDGLEPAIGPTLEALARDPLLPSLLDYSPHAGLERHRAAGAEWIGRSGLQVTADRVVVTAGAQNAILVSLAATTRPGDRVACDQLTYSGMQVVARLLGLRLEGLPSDDHGMRPDAFEAACRHGDLKAVYLVPTVHNPTTVTMPLQRRRALAETARAHGVAIIEDDIFALLAQQPVPPPVSSLAPDCSYFLTSLSKTIAPGLRIGYVAGPPGARDRLAAAVRAASWAATPLTAEIATRWIGDGTADRIMAARKAEAAARCEIALRILGRWQPACPPGSIFLWLPLPEPWRASDFALAAQRRDVAVTPAEACAVGRPDVPAAVRVSLGPPRDRIELERGLRALARLLESGRAQALEAIV
ncbi:MAG: PLP-dependent aminotransferase family protein [Kiloniellales bacterium]